ncbi:hypothetical protein NQ315_004435 [Exocentrus adspersus]|uniref:Uncharacterized protein n=1 Tax=Exocentrus adspersus TaxID=1586481 RepID=A0AAV8VAE9_9CUCU|nr:hypothetical protein NQ315_004435 [Exocentrus adspersus]
MKDGGEDIPKNRPSDSSGDDIVATQKFTKNTVDSKTVVVAPPPRPPKPTYKASTPCYLNLTPSKTSKEAGGNEEPTASKESQKILTDELYDLPRSHFDESTLRKEAHMRKHFNVEEDQRRIRAAPSPTPPSLGRSHDSLLSQNDNEQIYHYLASKIEYLDLDLDSTNSNFSGSSTKAASARNQKDTVYKEVDFMKTQAFNITRNNLEKERQEPITFSKK